MPIASKPTPCGPRMRAMSGRVTSVMMYWPYLPTLTKPISRAIAMRPCSTRLGLLSSESATPHPLSLYRVKELRDGAGGLGDIEPLRAHPGGVGKCGAQFVILD